MKQGAAWLLVILFLPAAAAQFGGPDTLTENFESYSLLGFTPETKPGLDWYTYLEGRDIGQVTGSNPVTGAQSFRINSAPGSDASSANANFQLNAPTTITSMEFKIRGVTLDDDGAGSEQRISIQSESPRRDMVEFYLFCRDAANPTGCDLRVRWQQIDSTGQVLVPASVGNSTFKIKVVPNWLDGTFRLFVDDVDDGVFPFLQQPSNVARLRIAQYQTNVALDVTFDDWVTVGGFDTVTSTTEGDIANGLKAFPANTNLNTGASLFLFGFIVFIILAFAVITPIIALGKDNTLTPALVFYLTLIVFWLIDMEWWPEWMGIAIIIAVAALVSLTIRQGLMGIRDASTNAGIVAGGLGYFIIASSLLGMSGYATETIVLPTSSLETPDDLNETVEKQSFVGAIAECSANIFTLGLFNLNCTQKEKSTNWAKITDIASSIFNFARTAFTFLFQLLTFQLPIPGIFNAVIILPPAAALATVGFSYITGRGQ